MKKTCYLLLQSNSSGSQRYEIGVFLHETEAIAEMWRLASIASRTRNLPVADNSRSWVLVDNVCFAVHQVEFRG